MVLANGVMLLDPTAENIPEEHGLNTRLATLKGTKVGLLDNTHRNVDIYLEEAERILKRDYGVSEVVHSRKANANSAAAPSILEEMVNKVDAVIHAVAD